MSNHFEVRKMQINSASSALTTGSPRKRSHLLRALGLASLLWTAASSPSHAAIVQAGFTRQLGDSWTAAFTVGATGAQEISSFTIYLDVDRASNVAVRASPAQWDTLAVQADPTLASDAYFDALLVAGVGVRAGAPLAGFEISFSWLGAAAPAALRFTINDASTFAVLETGTTVSAAATPLPEPPTWTLFALSVGLLTLGSDRSKRYLASV
jgi:hypothetical protein